MAVRIHEAGHQHRFAQVNRLAAAVRGQITPTPNGGDALARHQNRALANRRLGNRQNNAGAQEEWMVGS
jgi:hypothetical protein